MRPPAVLFAVLATALLFVVQPVRAETDGAYWKSLTPECKPVFFAAFVEGMFFGSNLLIEAAAKVDESVVKSRSVYNDLVRKYFGPASIGDVMKGLDAFYADPADDCVPLRLGVFHVLRKASGESQKSLDDLKIAAKARWCAK